VQISIFNAFSANMPHNISNVKNNTNPVGQIKFNSQGDQFIKSKSISFTGSNEGTKKTDMNKVGEDLLAIGIGSAPLLLGIGAVIWTTKYENSHEKYLADGSVVVDKKDQTIDSDKISADGKTGAIKIEGTGIDLSPKRFDFVDQENGIYENSEKGIYIDLPHNTYIDPENGILVDPDSEIAAVKVDGKYNDMLIPHIPFKGSQIGEGLDPGKPLTWGDLYHYGNEDVPLTREEHFKMFGEYPENDPHYLLNGKIIPDDNRADDQKSILENIKDLVNPQHHFRDDLNYDIFGREIIQVPGSNGQIHNIVMDDNLKEFTKEHELTGDELNAVAKFAHEDAIKNYVEYKHDLDPSTNHTSMSQFLQKAREDITIKEKEEHQVHNPEHTNKPDDEKSSTETEHPYLGPEHSYPGLEHPQHNLEHQDEDINHSHFNTDHSYQDPNDDDNDYLGGM